jgi:phosphotransferase system enzyme I (PtsI)
MASKPEMVFQGSGVSAGVVLGQALKIDSHNRLILKIRVDNPEEEVLRFLKAVELSKEQLTALKSRLEEKVGSEHSIILDAHLLILEDRNLNAEILALIRNSKANAEWAVIPTSSMSWSGFCSICPATARSAGIISRMT